MQATKLSQLPAHPFSLSLYVRHPSMDPADISRELQCEADESFRAGELRKSQSGMAVGSVHGETYWAATLDPTFWTAIGTGKRRSAIGDPSAAAASRSARSSGLEWLSQIAGSASDASLDALLGAQVVAAAATRTVGGVLSLVCARLACSHGSFFSRIRTEGAHVRLVVTLSPRTVSGFSLVPEVSLGLGRLGIQVEFEFALAD
jgi:hypothetical protein